ncbi:inositol 1,4,5-trisphosphate receptor-interacting protein-like 1 isoform X2 [Cyanistes caeruleus]|uniref:Inositol 1,4,5-trisphosphate receptor-interacting protein-like 1 n=1 Tax=Cyanistes caeruleus TaxID=156563 RepID=A0A8C0V069_CYACU|nr:inositol 1,4,5-trisphosphate receptor-interacting protein-like 1 isoform X2 [Cyanistes caeruleus]
MSLVMSLAPETSWPGQPCPSCPPQFTPLQWPKETKVLTPTRCRPPALDAGLQAIMVILLLFWLVQWICYYIKVYLDKDLSQRTGTLKEFVCRTVEQCVRSWRAMLWAALQQWLFWAIAGTLVLLLAHCWRLRKRISVVDNRRDSEREESEEELPTEKNMIWIISRHYQLSVPKLASGRRVVEELLSDLLQVSHSLFSDSFFPVLQPAIGVGSAFEGWSHHKEKDVVYCMFVPLKPPHGHAFLLEPDTMGEMSQRSMRIRVELVCTCTRKQPDRNMLCFLHHSEEELKRNQMASLLHTLCTGPYLDGEKIALWFQTVVISAWSMLPQSCHYSMKVLPSCRSCKVKLMKASGRSFIVEIVFSVQQGDSDIFLSSQPTEAQFPPSTTWLESYAVAEAKFFRQVAMQAPPHSCHLKCLRLCARILEDSGLSIYALKTSVMHLLTLIPLSEWQHKYFLMRVDDTLNYLRCCLEEARLKHFFFGNEDMPEEISLPPAFQEAQPLNLFQHLAQNPAAQTEALNKFYKFECDLFFGF